MVAVEINQPTDSIPVSSVPHGHYVFYTLNNVGIPPRTLGLRTVYEVCSSLIVLEYPVYLRSILVAEMGRGRILRLSCAASALEKRCPRIRYISVTLTLRFCVYTR